MLRHLALAVAGDTARAQELANDLQMRFPEDTSVVCNYLPALRGMLALRHGTPANALESLQAAEPNELGVSAEAFNYFFGTLDPVYARGQALLAANHPAEAAAEWNKLVAHRGLLMVDPLEAFAHLQLARAYSKIGDSAKAKAAYGDLLSLWKDADPGIPILQEAKADYAKIQ